MVVGELVLLLAREVQVPYLAEQGELVAVEVQVVMVD
jgi:hypothetical protein